MEKSARISVVMPIYNAEKYVAEAIESVLAQTYQDLELICVNDGSTDRSMEVVRSFGERVRSIENSENLGIAAARNHGVSESSGTYLAFIDADDVWEPEKLSRQMDALSTTEGASLCFTFMQCFLSPELSEEVKRSRHCPAQPMPAYTAGTLLTTRAVFEQVGPFDESLRLGEFVDWYTRAQDMGFKSHMLSEVLHHRRIHDTNTGIQERPSRADYLKVVRSALSRRRK